MIKQYPHFLFVLHQADSVQDEDTGEWIAVAPAWQFHSVCREEPNGKGSVVNGTDGKAIVFASTVFMPISAARIKESTEVLVSESNDVAGISRIKGTVLKFDQGQLNRRLWV